MTERPRKDELPELPLNRFDSYLLGSSGPLRMAWEFLNSELFYMALLAGTGLAVLFFLRAVLS